MTTRTTYPAARHIGRIDVTDRKGENKIRDKKQRGTYPRLGPDPIPASGPGQATWVARLTAGESYSRAKLALIREHWLEAVRSSLEQNSFVLEYAFHRDSDDEPFGLNESNGPTK